MFTIIGLEGPTSLAVWQDGRRATKVAGYGLKAHEATISLTICSSGTVQCLDSPEILEVLECHD